MNYSAVIFDLFGTLTDNFSSREYETALTEMALALSIPSDDFRRMWFNTSRNRNASAIRGCKANVEYICSELGTRPERKQISNAVQTRLNYIRYVMKPRPDAVEVLRHLRERGYKTGLISDCSHEIPVIWPETPLASLIDAAVFSCSVGFRKPTPRIYELAVERLHVPSGQCLYVGDGGSQELSGALRVGMHPVLIRLDADSTEMHLVDREQWDGPTIHSLREVLTMATVDCKLNEKSEVIEN
ncbi:HAD family hydrolase [Chloroflexota bacterium]